MRSIARSFLLSAFLLLPVLAEAQTTLAGVARDASGAVLPGVTVDASSPALIEKSRTAVTDGSGLYRITDLPPGTYSVTYTLTGFSRVVREGLMLSGSGAMTVDVELRLGGLEETLTVTGESPIVDVQTTRRETVLSNDVLESLPLTRSYTGIMTNIASLMPTGGVGAETNPGQINRFTAHGGRQNEGRISINGLLVTEPGAGAGVSSLAYDVANVDEIQVLVSGGLGEAETGGPIMNLVPRSGGNAFAGSAFYSGAGEWSRANNVDDELRAIGILEPSALINAFDLSGSLGGPILRDRLWFFGSARTFGQATAVSGAYANLYAGDPAHWDYARNEAVVTRNASRYDIFSIRLTEQVTPRNRVSFSQENQYRCQGSALTESGEGCRGRSGDWIAIGNATNAPEAFPGYHDLPYYVTQATWSSPVSNRLLLDAGFSRFHYRFAGNGQVPPDGLTDLIPVTEQSSIYGLANFSYRGLYDPNAHAFADNKATSMQWRATASHVTGAHNFKVGYMGSSLLQTSGRVANDSQLRYTFNNRSPISFGYVLAPRWDVTDHTMTTALFAQDQWTLGKLTLQGAIRYDRAWSWAPAEGNGTTDTSIFNPQPISFERTVSVKGYNDITPRMGAALRSVRQRQDGDQGQSREVPQECGSRRRLFCEQPRCEDRHPDHGAGVDGRQPELPDRLRRHEPASAGQPGIWRRSLRRAGWERPQLRQSESEPDDHRPGDPGRVGCSGVGLAVRRVGAAGSVAARGPGSRLQPALVPELPRDGQPAHRTWRLRAVDVDGAAASRPSGRRRLPGDARTTPRWRHSTAAPRTSRLSKPTSGRRAPGTGTVST